VEVGAADLSEGERQLLSLARALIAGQGPRGLRTLLCDEPTSALDMESDGRVHEALLGLSCSVVEVAHRLHAIERFDKVVVMEGGRVAEVGPAAELLQERGGWLASLVARADGAADVPPRNP
jgi:ABC-type multidrug transport system fused ATPase/permease subunit